MPPCNMKSILHTESRRNARKAFLALSGSKNDKDQEQSSDKPSLDQAVAGSLEEMRVSGNTPVCSMIVFGFITWAYFLVGALIISVSVLRFCELFSCDSFS